MGSDAKLVARKGSMPPVDWSSYAAYFDLTAAHNPAYQAILQDVRQTFASLELLPGTIADIGAGTGNFSVMLASALPDHPVLHVEPDPNMIDAARNKAAAIPNLAFLSAEAEHIPVQPNSWSAAVTIHALYAMRDPARALTVIHENLMPGGYLYLVDLGKEHDSLDWGLYFFRSARKSIGFWGGVRLMARLAGLARQTARITGQQQSRRSWTHDVASLSVLCANLGFTVLRGETVYRGYSSMLLCRKD